MLNKQEIKEIIRGYSPHIQEKKVERITSIVSREVELVAFSIIREVLKEETLRSKVCRISDYTRKR